jgi:periplasmic protein TonB
MQAVKRFSLAGSGRLMLVIGLHVLAIYLIATSLGIVEAPGFVEPMEAVMIEAPKESKPVKPAEVKPELVEPTLELPEPDTVPIPEVDVPAEAPAAISATQSNAVEATELQVANRVAPAYPPASLRAGEEGAVTFRVLVDERGHPLQVNVMKSSGHARLDDAAMRAVRRWVFVPPTRNGQPVRSWSRVSVRFELKNA